MKLKNLGLFILLAGIILSCRETLNEVSEEENFIRAGQVNDALFYSSLERPDRVIIDTKHEDEILIDLNNDGVMEFVIVSEEDSITRKDSEQNLRDYHIKSLYLRKIRDDIFVSVESITFPGYVGIIQENSILGFTNQIWNPLDSVKLLCYWEKDVLTEFSHYEGLWNNRTNKYFAVNFQHEGQTIMAWIELTVIEYDNYILHNYASFILE